MKGSDVIAHERQRQIEKGYDQAHDLEHGATELRQAALAVLVNDWQMWPWDDGWVDARSRREQLVVAGALLAAAIDVFDDGLETSQ